MKSWRTHGCCDLSFMDSCVPTVQIYSGVGLYFGNALITYLASECLSSAEKTLQGSLGLEVLHEFCNFDFQIGVF